MSSVEFGERYAERIWETHVAEDFERDVVAGLLARNKAIPSKYLYDALGSLLFEAIVLLPEYDLPRREVALLERHAATIVSMFRAPIHLLELGSGSSLKTRLLLEAAIALHGEAAYTPIDISLESVRSAAKRLLARYPVLRVRALVGDYFQVLGEATQPSPTLALFLGSNLGNYPGERGRALLQALHRSLSRDDLLLLGVDLRKDPAVMERAYNDAIGVTAAFSKNLLARVNRDLGAEIEIENFRHHSRFDERTGSIETHLVAERAANYSLGANRARASFAAGERIHIESSHKFTRAEIRTLAEASGFAERAYLPDADEAFALIVLQRCAEDGGGRAN